MTAYASGTEVSPGKSREEIERVLSRYGADEFAYATNTTRAMLGFVAGGRQVRFVLPLPDRSAPEFRLTASRKWERSEAQQQAAYEQEVRRRWRALSLVIKAKLEAVASGIVLFEQEFAAFMVLPDGSTVAEHLLPAIADAYATGTVPPLIPSFRPALESGRDD